MIQILGTHASFIIMSLFKNLSRFTSCLTTNLVQPKSPLNVSIDANLCMTRKKSPRKSLL